ncbi:MAG: DUF1579 family protein [Kordiimonadaceae bacterium]|nr:DUF1579 family protein [Kordiimonadaceae bacterium]MBO6570115.1 DUF1579 family protein [Kordiimonadaceae bacterium]MBO6965787.1 DUF1579 family protein [Kordiimonadaceae bacterium]
MKKLLLLVLLLSPWSVAAHGQENVPGPSKEPLAAMEQLKDMLGTWQMVTDYSPDNGKTWQKSPPARSEFTLRQKGMMLVETPLDTDQPGFHLETIFGYDQYRDVYRLIAIDDYWGIVDLYEGTIEDNKLVVTNLKSGTFFPINETTSRAFQIAIDLTGDTRKMVIHKSDDGGKSWQPNFTITYTKL